MRYVPIQRLKEGMILGQDIHDASGRLLLAKHSFLSKDNISYMVFIGIPGIYVEDEFSKEIQIEQIIRPEVKQTAVELVCNLFNKINHEDVTPEEKRIQRIVTELVDNILEQKDVMYNLLDVKTYDDYTYFHSVNVAVLAGIIGVKCGLDRSELEALVTAAFLHDVGKVFIDKELINAPRALTPAERLKMMEHPLSGYEKLSSEYDFSEDICKAVYQHHEWYDGKGYPCGITGENTLKISKILKIADVYDAMTSKRPYHDAYLPSEVIEYMMARGGSEFDPELIQVMCEEFCVYPVGTEVVLSDGRIGIVIENHKGYTLRPTVKITETKEVIPLSSDRDSYHLTIAQVLL